VWTLATARTPILLAPRAKSALVVVNVVADEKHGCASIMHVLSHVYVSIFRHFRTQSVEPERVPRKCPGSAEEIRAKNRPMGEV